MNGWLLGYAIGLVVVVVVVVVVLQMIAGARRTASKVEMVIAELDAARDGTEPLWELATTVSSADRIVAAAVGARERLTPGGPSHG